MLDLLAEASVLYFRLYLLFWNTEYRALRLRNTEMLDIGLGV